MGQILNQTLTTEKENNAILSKSKGLTKKIEEEKLEYRARKALIKEKKALKEKDHVLPDIRTMDYERKLKKVATSGGKLIFSFYFCFI
ncbi:hypothetical protein K502DRAFT_322571 [Neoconidiobolus thromboides FSU 785]|nr:hypothetical protein K502DRAFT_322571 [Neoconidiobolus thromboides FSU 785]